MKNLYLKTTKTSAPTSIVTVPGLTFSRISGTGRYSTAVEASKAAFPDSGAGAPVVWIASGENFPDALSAGPAAAKQNGPLLLTRSGELPAVTLAELHRLHPAKIVLVGGTTVVTTAVEAQLKKVAPTTRIAGANRYEVSRKIVAYAFGTTATRGGKTAVYIATGTDFPDAISGGAAAAAKGVPLLLVKGTAASADAATISSLNTLGVKELLVVGGASSMPASITKSLAAIAPVTSIAGSDRFQISHDANIRVDGKVDTIYITTGRDFPDALAGIPLAAKKKAPLLLVPGDCLPSTLIASIQSLGIRKVVIIGGTASVSEAVTRSTVCG
jgi:putative cell wall-binding protein